MSMTTPVLELANIHKRFGSAVALDGAKLTLRAGEAHALMGANGAGKSTLMNILGGILQRSEGEIRVAGAPVEIASPRDARRLGISFVHQELNMLPSMSVAENVLIDELPTKGPFIAAKQMRERVQTILERLGCGFSPDIAVEALGMGDRQMVEVARALASDPQILIFDEPTSSLSKREKLRLFDVIAKLKAAGTAIVYITHFLDEIFETCERVTVMRNGKTVASGPLADYRPHDIVTHMLGDVRLEERLRPPRAPQGDPVLEVDGISREGALEDVSFQLHPGEIVGLWGLLGSGRTEILRGLVGLDGLDAGQIRLRKDGRMGSVSPADLHAEVGFVTEDRRGEGLLLPLPVASNISFANFDKVLGRFGLIDRKRERRFGESFAERLKIKLHSITQPVRTLSGGNQQKVVFARWLGTAPRLFFLDEPTRGLDVGAKGEILKLTAALAESGATVLLASSELEEMMSLCDRYLIVQRGRIVGELPGTADKEMLMQALSGSGAGG
jgi:ABC-type sugar transport system ATPase subunit